MRARRRGLACCCATRSVRPRKDLWTHESAPPPPRRESDDQERSGRASRGRDASAGRLEHAAGGGYGPMVLDASSSGRPRCRLVVRASSLWGETGNHEIAPASPAKEFRLALSLS